MYAEDSYGEELWRRNTLAPISGGGRNTVVSTLLSGRVTLLNGFQDDIALFVHSQNTKRKYLFKGYIENGLKNWEFCLYASNEEEKRIEKNFFFFSLKKAEYDPEAIARLDDDIKKMKEMVEKGKEYVGLRILLDLDKTPNKDNKDKIIQLMKNISKLQRKKFPVTALAAVDVSCMDQKFFEALVSIVPKVVFSTDDETTISFINTYPNQPVAVDFLDHEIAVDFVKKFLEPIIFSMLLRKSMCGYDIIKEISNDYHVLLSQGTVYPLLYSLNKMNILEVKNDAKAKKYIPTKDGRFFMEKRLNDFRKGYAYFFSLLKTPQTMLPI